MSRDQKVIISEMENKLEGTRQHRGKNSGLDDAVIETNQNRGGKTEKQKQSITELQDNVNKPNTCLTEIPKGGESKKNNEG